MFGSDFRVTLNLLNNKTINCFIELIPTVYGVPDGRGFDCDYKLGQPVAQGLAPETSVRICKDRGSAQSKSQPEKFGRQGISILNLQFSFNKLYNQYCGL